MLSKLAIRVESSSGAHGSYGAQLGSPVVATQLEGGAPRFRADYVGIVSQVEVSWTVEKDGYDYLMAFFRTSTFRGSQPFLIDLILDYAAITEYTAYFVPETFKLESQQGLAYVVVASLYVLPLPDDPNFDALALAKFDAAQLDQ